jgi:hypothetical protein
MDLMLRIWTRITGNIVLDIVEMGGVERALRDAE